MAGCQSYRSDDRGGDCAVAGFTLAELLIALAIIGVITTFAIPKILQSQADTKFRAIAKEVAGMISAAHTAHQLEGKLSSATNAAELTPYLNYVKLETGGAPGCTFDFNPGDTTIYGCDEYPYPGVAILRLHNGALLIADPNSFGGSAQNYVTWFMVDPDGQGTGRADSLWFMLYYNGRITTWATCASGTQDSTGFWACPDPGQDPAWFGWD